MTPQTVNAYYNPTTNEITFPAAILQPPFFDSDRGRCGELRRHRLGDRPRDQPRLRRFAAGSSTATATCATGGRPRTARSSSSARTTLVKQFAGYTRARRPPHQRRAHARREHRRPCPAWRSRSRPTRLSLAGKTGARDRRVHRRAALLPWLGAGLAPQVSRRGIAQAPADRSAQPE